MEEAKTFTMQSTYCQVRQFNCLCRSCPENRAYNKDGNCMGCNDCGNDEVTCLMTGN